MLNNTFWFNVSVSINAPVKHCSNITTALFFPHKQHSHPIFDKDMAALRLHYACSHTRLCTFMHVFICAHVYHFLIMLIVAELGMCIHPDGQNHLLPTRTLNLILRVMDLISQWTKSIILRHAWAHGRLFGYSVTLSQALTACNYRARHRNWYIFIVV